MATAGRSAGGRADAGTSREPDCESEPAGAAPRSHLKTPPETPLIRARMTQCLMGHGRGIIYLAGILALTGFPGLRGHIT